MKPWFCGLAAIVFGWGNSTAASIDWTAEPLKEVKIETVAFRGWSPDTTEPLQGTLVLIPGRHGDGRSMAGDARWQTLATNLHFAILACQFTNGDPGLYQGDDRGTVAKAINEAVEHLAKESRHPELTKAPLAFWGTSAGSNVSSRYCTHYPERVAAFASSKGTWGPSGDVSRSNTEIPMFFAIGQKDNPEWVAASTQNIEKGMKAQTPWTLALHPSEGHGVGASLDVAIPFLESAVKQRLGVADGGSSSGSIFKSQLPSVGSSSISSSSSTKLKKIDIHAGWLGDPKTLDIAAYDQFKGSKSKAVWLPDEATAMAWQAYLRQ
jgi:dienelactone hydrolase